MGYVKPNVTILVGVALMALALVLEVVGLAAPGWCTMWIGEKGETMVGLWEYCYEQPNFTCEDLDNLWSIKGWLEACRAMGVMAVMAQAVCLMSVLLLCFLSQVLFFFAIAPWAALTAGMLIFLEFGIFVVEVELRKNSLGRDFYYHYAFVLTILAFVFSLFASLFFFIGEARNRRSLK